MVERIFLGTTKQQRKYHRYFEMQKFLRKGNNCIFRLYHQTIQVQCMNLAFKMLKISSEKSQQ